MHTFKELLEAKARDYDDAGALAEQEAWANHSAPFKFNKEDAATLVAAREARAIGRALWAVLATPDVLPVILAAKAEADRIEARHD